VAAVFTPEVDIYPKSIHFSVRKEEGERMINNEEERSLDRR
jgi:hypothetical protein